MGRRAQRTSCSLLFVLLAVALAPTLAGAQTQTPWKDQLVVVPDTADMTLYEATENMRFLGRALLSGQSGKRKATSELMGVARRNTPLCPPLDPATDATNPCVVNATGTSDVDLTTGRGNIVGTVTVVIQGDNPFDSPELVVKKGKFVGKIDFSRALPALNPNPLPFGTLSALLVVDGGGVSSFTGTFRQPVSAVTLPSALNPCPLTDLTCAVYFAGFMDPTMSIPVFVPVKPNEFALSYPTVRLEIKFDPQTQ